MRGLPHSVLRVVAMAAVVLLVGVPIVGLVAERRAETAFVERTPPAGRLVDIGGRRMHLECAGTGSPVVVLEATGLGTTLQYRGVLGALSHRTMACAYDRAGMGFSDPADDARSARDMARDLATMLDAAHVARPILLVAGSLGGVVAELFARERPGDVAGLVMLDALTSTILGDPMFDALASKACGVRWAAELGLLRWADPFHLARSNPLAFEVTYRAPTWQAVCQSMRDLPETAAQLRAAPRLRADVPLTVVVHGEPRDFIPMATPDAERAADPRWLAAQRAFAARSSRGRFVVASASGHLIADERPDLVIREVETMLDGGD